MSNLWYTPGNVPVTQSRGSSATIRAEFAAVEAAFDKYPTPAQTWGAMANYAVAGGATDAWTASLAATYLTAYTDGLTLRVKFGAANTSTTPTLNLNALGAKVIVSEAGAPLGAGDIAAGSIHILVYNSTTGKFQIFLGNAVAAAAAQATAAAASAAASQVSRLAAETAEANAETAETNAELAETNAETAEANAAAHASTAQSAAAAALAAGRIYPDTTTGLAAVASGEYFCVPAVAGSNDFLILYLDNAGVAVEQARFPSSVLVQYLNAQGAMLATNGVFTDYVGTSTPGAGTSVFSSASTSIFSKPLPRNCRIARFTVSCGISGTLKIKRYTRSGNTFTFQSEISVAVGALTAQVIGPEVLSALNCTAGDYIGLYAPANVLRITTGATNHDAQYTNVAGDNITTATYSGSFNTNRPEAKIEFYAVNEALLDTQTASGKAAAQQEETGSTLTIGASTPADNASTLAIGSAFFERSATQESGVLEEYAVYSKLAGDALLLVIKPSTGGGYTLLHKQRFTHSAAAITTLRRSDGTLPLVKMPRGCLVGVMPLVASSLTIESAANNAGYYSLTGEPTGVLTAALTSVLAAQVQQRFKVAVASYKRKRDDGNPRYNLCDIDITAAAQIPAFARSLNVSYSSGYATNTSTGILGATGAYVESLRSSNDNRTESTHVVKATSADAKVAVYRRPVLGLASVDEGSVFYFDLATNTIALTATWAGGNATGLPANATGGSKTCGFTIPQNVDLVLKLRNDRKQITGTITNPLTGDTDNVSLSSDATDLAGFAYGVAGTAVLTGTAGIKSIRHRSLPRDPVLAIIGTSIEEGSGTTQPNAWANLVADALDGRAIVCGDGGTSTDAQLRVLRDILATYPSVRAVALGGGTNDASAGATGVTNYQTRVPLMKALCDAYGVEFIACYTIPRNDANQTHANSINTWLDTSGYRLVNMHKRISTGHDGSTWNSSNMADTLHPNATGNGLMSNQFQIDQAWLFDWYGTDI